VTGIEDRLNQSKLRETGTNGMDIQQGLSPPEGGQQDALSIPDRDSSVSSMLDFNRAFIAHVVNKILSVARNDHYEQKGQ
jgi:hypothetical protein